MELASSRSSESRSESEGCRHLSTSLVCHLSSSKSQVACTALVLLSDKPAAGLTLEDRATGDGERLGPRGLQPSVELQYDSLNIFILLVTKMRVKPEYKPRCGSHLVTKPSDCRADLGGGEGLKTVAAQPTRCPSLLGTKLCRRFTKLARVVAGQRRLTVNDDASKWGFREACKRRMTIKMSNIPHRDQYGGSCITSNP